MIDTGTDRQTDGRIDRQMGGQIDRQSYEQIKGQSDKRTDVRTIQTECSCLKETPCYSNG